LQQLLAGGRPQVVDGQTLDPHLHLLTVLRRLRRVPGLVEPDYRTGRARFRREMRALAGPVEPVGRVHDFTIDGPGGAIAVRHYVPEAPPTRPLLVYLHGGGFVIGDLDTHDQCCRIICREARIHVLAVDYRLAPEHPFPAAVDDATAALHWARAHAASLGADPARVALGGDSAGGNLTAVVSAAERDRGAPPFVQLLIYPVVDAATDLRPSAALFGEGYFLSNADRAAFSRHYLGARPPSAIDPRLAPLRARDFGGLPPSLVVTAGFDTLRDEGEEYAAALDAAGVDVRLRRFASLGHGFVNMTGITPSAREAMIQIGCELRALLDAAHRSSSAP